MRSEKVLLFENHYKQLSTKLQAIKQTTIKNQKKKKKGKINSKDK